MAAAGAMGVFDKLVTALRSGPAGRAKPLFEKLRALESREVEKLLFQLDAQRAEDKSLVLGYQNALALEEMKKLVAARGGLDKVRGLALVPFCLQAVPCPHKIVWDSDNCRRCCACAVGPVALFADALKWPLRVAARARFAPQFVAEVKPELVLALACPHEALAGLLRVRDVPVYSLALTTPQGPCRNTHLGLSELADFARSLGREWQPPKP